MSEKVPVPFIPFIHDLLLCEEGSFPEFDGDSDIFETSPNPCWRGGGKRWE